MCKESPLQNKQDEIFFFYTQLTPESQGFVYTNNVDRLPDSLDSWNNILLIYLQAKSTTENKKQEEILTYHKSESMLKSLAIIHNLFSMFRVPKQQVVSL